MEYLDIRQCQYGYLFYLWLAVVTNFGFLQLCLQLQNCFLLSSELMFTTSQFTLQVRDFFCVKKIATPALLNQKQCAHAAKLRLEQLAKE